MGSQGGEVWVPEPEKNLLLRLLFEPTALEHLMGKSDHIKSKGQKAIFKLERQRRGRASKIHALFVNCVSIVWSKR